VLLLAWLPAGCAMLICWLVAVDGFEKRMCGSEHYEGYSDAFLMLMVHESP